MTNVSDLILLHAWLVLLFLLLGHKVQGTRLILWALNKIWTQPGFTGLNDPFMSHSGMGQSSPLQDLIFQIRIKEMILNNLNETKW